MSLRLVILSYGPAQSAPATGPSASILARDINSVGTHSARANDVFFANGTWQGIIGGSPETGSAGAPYSWLTGGASTDFDILAKRTGGTSLATFSAGWANNSWMPLSTNRWLSITELVTGNLTVQSDISIRYNSNSTLVGTASHFMSADSFK